MTYLEWKENYRQERINKNEIWKDIPDYEGLYQASTLGNIKALSRIRTNGRGNYLLKEHIVKGGISGSGYRNVSLSKNSEKKTFSVHVLIAITFLNHIPDGRKTQVDHIKEGSKLNNNVNNLQLLTARWNTIKHRKTLKTSSQYIGVSFKKNINKWQSYILIDKKLNHLGYFDNEIEASDAYQNKLKSL